MTALVRQILAINLILLLTLSGGYARIASHLLSSPTARYFQHCNPPLGAPAPGNHDCVDGCPVCQTSLDDFWLLPYGPAASLLRRAPERSTAGAEASDLARAAGGGPHRARAPPATIIRV